MQSDFTELDHVEKLLLTLEIPYFYIGGWGIDLFLGYRSRDHSDIEITIYRYQQQKLYSWAMSPEIRDQGYTLHVVDPPGTANIPIWEGQPLELPIHQLQLYREENRIVDIMLSDLNNLHSSEVIWQFRRDPRIVAPKSQIERFYIPKSKKSTHETSDSRSLPYHAPEILLLYKSKRNEKKDRWDRDLAWSKMSLAQQQWFINAIHQYDVTHVWLVQLLPL